MTLRYRYKLISSGTPIVSLGGRFGRPRPLITVTLMGPADTAVLEAILDTGADDTVFSENTAVLIGLDLTNAPTSTAAGVGGGNAPLRYAEVALRLTDGQERREWKGMVGFTPARFRYPMLGFAGCLQFFDTLFRGALEEVELTVNSLYPGT
jgi:hypothetical protein